MSLRRRYRHLLADAYRECRGREVADVTRIKLTAEIVGAAKTQWAELESWRRAIAAMPLPAHARRASAFARAAIRRGEHVRVRLPNGPRGSWYVRVGRRGSVSFADHAAPREWASRAAPLLGGFSSELRRRHRPAALSVAPGEATPAEAARWLREMTV